MDAIEIGTDATVAQFRMKATRAALAMLKHADGIIAAQGSSANWEARVVKDHKGQEVEVTVPGFWSDNAAKVIATKYFRRAGVPSATSAIPEDGIPQFLWRHTATASATFGGETSAHQTFHRLAGCWTYWLCRRTVAGRPALLDEAAAGLVYKALFAGLRAQMFAPNSPQWFNSGLHWAYGIDAEALGHFHIDPDSNEVVESTSAYGHPQVHACFISSIEDDLVGPGGILDLWRQEARIFKGGSGDGANYSKLRAKDETLSGGGVSSGMMSFLKTGDASAGAIKSGGTTRRSARMVVVDDDHPEVVDFIRWKAVEERKVAALAAGSMVTKRHLEAIVALLDAGQPIKGAVALAKADGVPMGMIQKAIDRRDCGLPQVIEEYDTYWEGLGYETVSGQNANNSVSVRDRLMNGVATDADHHLTARKGGHTMRTMKARELWREIAIAAWDCADPGLHFRDTINKWHTVPASGEITASNPCSEFFHLDNTGCNLASTRLTRFHNPDTGFAAEAFSSTCAILGMVLDTSVSLGQYPSRIIAEKTRQTRTMGLGWADGGALLMRMGLAYDSDDGRAVLASITSLMTASAYRMSADVATVHGAFGYFADNREHVLRILRMHAKANHDLLAAESGGRNAATVAALASEAAKAWDGAIEGAELDGIRNAQATVLAPTGTIGFVMDCDTTGVEPDYALMKYKTLAGGGFMEIVNQSVEPALAALGYSGNEIGMVLGHLLEKKGLDDCDVLNDEHRTVFDCATTCGGGTRFIDPMGHVKMMAALQPFLSGGISKTVNLPSSATVDDIEDVHMKAWRMGLKSIAVYRDGSKLSQPLMSLRIEEAIGEAADGGTVEDAAARGDANTVAATLAAAAMAQQGRAVRLNKHDLPGRRNGYTQKMLIAENKIYLRTGEYENGQLGEIFIDMHKEGATFRALMNGFAIAISLGLQWGVPLEEFVEAFTFTRFEPAGVVRNHARVKSALSILDLIFRDLGISYLGREDLAHVKLPAESHLTTVEVATTIETTTETNENHALAADAEKANEADAGLHGRDKASAQLSNPYTGDQCGVCSSIRVRRAGTCGVCEDCGNSVGGCV